MSDRLVRSRARGMAGAASNLGSYVTLFTVRVQHGYYNTQAGRCTDFRARPSPDTARMMASVGMLFVAQDDGFTVLVPRDRLAALDAAVAGPPGGGPAAGGRAWTRLTILFVLTNPDFVGISQLPLGTNPLAECFYASNLHPASGEGGLRLGGASGIGASSLVGVTGPDVRVPARPGSVATLSDVSGATVYSGTAAGPAATLSLCGRPYGLYTAESTGPTGRKAAATLAYVPNAPTTAGLVDLFLARPPGGAGNPAAFPVTAAAGPGKGPDPVALVLPFRARETVWQYFVASQPGGTGRLDDLAIAGFPAGFRRSKALLPGGDPATVFVARAPLSLCQQAAHRFTLTGRRHGADGTVTAIRLAPMPHAPASPVWPATSGDPLSGRSEIFVYV